MIPGVDTYHPRSVWEAKLPSRYAVAKQNPPRQVPADIFRPVIHYPGVGDVPDGDPGERLEDVAQSIANSHRHYVDNRGYAYGYLFVVDWTGGVWEVRGFDYRSAANAGHNLYTCPVQLLIDSTGTPTDRQVDAAVAVFLEFRRRAGRTDFESRPWGHGELQKRTGIGTVTACPGQITQRLIDQGRFDLPGDGWKRGEGMGLHTKNPKARIVDTRSGKGDRRPNTPKVLQPGESLWVAIPDTPAGTRPHSAVVAVGVVAPSQPGWLQVDGDGFGDNSDGNYYAGEVRTFTTLAAVDDDGNVNVRISGGAAHVTVDLLGVID